MNKQMRELLEKINAKKAEAQGFLAKAKEAKTDEEKKDFKAKANVAFDEMKDFQEDYELEKKSFEAEKGNFVPVDETPKIDNKVQVRAFAKAIAKKPLTDIENTALSSLTGEDGGYLIPQDIQTRINELKRQYVSMRSLVTVEPVTTVEGKRVIEAAAERTAFGDITELQDIPTANSPQFKQLAYKIRDLGGLLPIPNDLLADETGGLVNYLAMWFVKKMYATDNDMILNSDGSKGSQGILGTAGTKATDGTTPVGFDLTTLTAKLTFSRLKTVLNKEFKSQIISRNAVIVTNQDGLDIIDQFADANGRFYLTGDGTEELPYRIKSRNVIVFDNEVLPNYKDAANKEHAPFIIGDLKMAMVLFDRQKMEVASSKEAGFKNNSTIMRAIVRQDSRIWDREAAKVYYSPLE